MGRKAIGWKNLWSLTVLVFLRLKPMHPYELQSIIRITHKDDFLQLNPGSLYNSIEWLLELLEAPAPDSIWFFAALSFLPAIPPPEAVEQLAKRVVNLKREIGNY